MNYETFVEISQKYWKDKHGFLLISKDYEMNNGRHRSMYYDLMSELNIKLGWISTSPRLMKRFQYV